MELFPKRACLICFRPAYCNNYGALTCDACKMFFRRVVKEKLFYECKTGNKCFQKYSGSPRLPACKACRYARCHEIGMIFANKNKKGKILEIKNEIDDTYSETLSLLLHANSVRAEIMKTCFTIMDPSVEEMVKDRGVLKMFVQPRCHPMSPSNWSFFALYTTIDFLLDLDFMSKLADNDKIKLLKSFTGQASLFAGAMRTFRGKGDKLMTVDGKDIYPDHIGTVLKISNGDDKFLNRIRSLLVSRLIELKMTDEEFVLVTVVLFCNPAIPDLSIAAKHILSIQQKTYSSLLLQYCQLTYQRFGPSRFNDLLSICTVIRRNFEDVQYLTMIFAVAMKGVKYKRIVEEVI